MSRLEAVAKGLFYPTPDRVVRAVTNHLAPPKNIGARQVMRVLDPCCGTGEQAAFVADALGADSYGVELNGDRAAAAQKNLGRVLHTTAFGIRMKPGAFGCLFMNPPYDTDEEKQRLEHHFLVTLSRALCTGGILVYIVPQARLEVSARYLGINYSNMSVYRFAGDDYDVFHQVVLFGVKKASAQYSLDAERMVKEWASADLPELPDDPVGALYTVPAHGAGEFLFAPDIYDPNLAVAEAARVGAWAHPNFTDMYRPAEQPMVQPLMPLRRGHLAMLISGGLLDDVVLNHQGRRMIVKGKQEKRMVDATSKDDREEGTVREREVLETSCVVLHLDDWRFERIGDPVMDEKPAKAKSAAE